MRLERSLEQIPRASGENLPPLMQKQRNWIEQPEVRFFSPGSKCQILAIVFTKDHLVIHLFHEADPIYENGGWVRIHPEIFVRPSFTEMKYHLKRAIDVPLYPNQHDYSSVRDYITFTLIFPKLPEGTTSFDLIEKEPSDNTFFNFYGVKLKSQEQIIK